MTRVAEEAPLVGAVKSKTSSASANISELLSTVSENPMRTLPFAEEQQKDPYLHAMHKFLEKQQLPEDLVRARRITLQAPMFTVSDKVLYFIDPKPVHRRQIAVTKQLRKDLLDKTHRSRMGGQFLGQRLYNAVARNWWWEGMYSDALKFSHGCPKCLIVKGTEGFVQLLYNQSKFPVHFRC